MGVAFAKLYFLRAFASFMRLLMDFHMSNVLFIFCLSFLFRLPGLPLLVLLCFPGRRLI